MSSRYGWVVVAVSATVSSLAWSVRSTISVFYVRAPRRIRLATRGGGARLLLELAVAPRLLAPGRLALRSLGRQAPGAGGRATPRRGPRADRSRVDALAVVHRLRRSRRRGHRLHPGSCRRHRRTVVRSFPWRGDGRHQRGRLGQRDHLLPGEHVPDRRLRLAHGAGDLRGGAHPLPLYPREVPSIGGRGPPATGHWAWRSGASRSGRCSRCGGSA